MGLNLRAEDIACIRCRIVVRSSVGCRMRDCAEEDGHPTFTDFPTDKQYLWFRQFAQEFTWNTDETFFIYHHFVHKVMDNYGKQIHEWKKKWEINKVR
ncbi:hypothetical protein DY000_02004652 [Brassica cretica]|uniref:Uncharacterized protein n=1 Tax=Brassica cretica TaxID=69181 RepID=A0ABQ7C7Y8_BRACR|nr:hypothetical protein DY000_02004652 [Brassica cretica]